MSIKVYNYTKQIFQNKLVLYFYRIILIWTQRDTLTDAKANWKANRWSNTVFNTAATAMFICPTLSKRSFWFNFFIHIHMSNNSNNLWTKSILYCNILSRVDSLLLNQPVLLFFSKIFSVFDWNSLKMKICCF